MNMVEANGVSKKFKNTLALDNVSLRIQEGEIFGLIGPNGAGKSTLINIMTGLIGSTTGDICVGGYSVRTDPIQAKSMLGLVPQELGLLEDVSAYDNLELFASMYGLYGEKKKKAIADAFELTGLTERKKEKVKKFSGGMKRRLNLAAAIMHKPRLLILDEPTVGVDPQSRNHIFNYLRRINQEGTTILYTSHYMEEVEQLCNSIFIIDMGREIASGTKNEIVQLVKAEDSVKLVMERVVEEQLLLLKGIPGVQNVTSTDEEINLSMDSTVELNQIIQAMEQKGHLFKEIKRMDPSLEEVFLALTGKSLRD
ncbi:MAG: ABC transporter ATP-binding protein [Tissierellia bacterium]|nr:ABC transporter ATP-binding protein [Tissierellia bacterium]